SPKDLKQYTGNGLYYIGEKDGMVWGVWIIGNVVPPKGEISEMWTPSKVRYFYGKTRHQTAVHSYITERSLFLEDIEDSLEDAYATLAHHGTKLQEEKAYGYRCYDHTNHIKLNLLAQSLERYKKQKLLGVK